jgi:excisionase family DNA binding protein
MTDRSASTDPITLAVPAAAKAVGVSSRTIQKFITTGELPSVQLGKRRLIRRVDLEAFIASRLDRRCRGPAASAAASD